MTVSWTDAARCEAMFGAGGAWCEVGAEAEPDQRDAACVDFVALDQQVDGGSDHVLEVGPEQEAALQQRRALAGAVEGEHVVAALERRGADPAVRRTCASSSSSFTPSRVTV